jgi:proline iminopeptidase
MPTPTNSASDLDFTDDTSDRVQLIPINTPKGTFQVWTKRVGTSPTMRLLLLHGGPGATHEYFEDLANELPAAGIELYLYDQLGSFHSDQPDEPDLWELPRFVDEVEQVRQALGLDRDTFFLLGHSWGGVLATGCTNTQISCPEPPVMRSRRICRRLAGPASSEPA